MLCTRFNGFITTHAFLTFLYITAITFVLTYKSLSRQKKHEMQEKSSLDMRTVAALMGFASSFFIFILFYCVFFFLKLKKVQYFIYN